MITEDPDNQKPRTNIADLFADSRARNEYLKVCAPMVRYSKLEFRTLIRKYGVDLSFTPMIMADSFCRSNKSRVVEFGTTRMDDTPLIAQFAANNVVEFVSGSEMLFPYVDGVDLNCGCPQKWAMSDGYGSAMLNSPEIIKDIICAIKRNFPSTFSISVKVRLLPKGITKTIELCRQLEKCGATFLTVHGRTCHEKTSVPVNKLAIKEIKDSLQIPVIANGDVMTLADADEFYEITGCDGIMSARGMLTNPALFAGHTMTPKSVLQDWTDLGYQANDNITFQCFHHHLAFMTEKLMTKASRIAFNSLSKKYQVYEFLEKEFNIVPNVGDDISQDFIAKSIPCIYNEDKVKGDTGNKDEYRPEHSNGKYFSEKIKLNQKNSSEDDGLEFMDCGGLFDE